MKWTEFLNIISMVFHSTAFLGGIALRFLYGLPHFLEDLDFSITEEKQFIFADMIVEIKKDFFTSKCIKTNRVEDRKLNASCCPYRLLFLLKIHFFGQTIINWGLKTCSNCIL